MFADLAPILWHSFGTIAALLQEIVSIYPLLRRRRCTRTRRTACATRWRCCSALRRTRRRGHCSCKRTSRLYLYPFLNTVSKTRPFEYLRLTSLGVIGALVKVDDSDVINFSAATEIIPLCLRIMETGSELSKTVATFIVQKILLDEAGLAYICATAERCYAVGTVLGDRDGHGSSEQPSARLLKHIVRCYLRLSDNPRARECAAAVPARASCATPPSAACLKDDVATQKWLVQLLMQLGYTNG